MDYLASPYHVETRRDPAALYPGLKSIIVVGMSYPLHANAQLDNSCIGLISGYATGIDYHVSIPRMLDPLVEFVIEIDSKAPLPRVFTDSAPIMERELAVRAGLGWIGKNSCLISPTHGSNILLAEIFTGVALETDRPFTADRCGSCTRCIDACPTGCILPDRKIDASRCLSYHSIENKGEIPPALMDKFGPWIFGCDICQMVCPWNTSRSNHLYTQNAIHLDINEMLEILDYTPADFSTRFGASAIARARWKGLVRNIIIRLANMRAVNADGAIRKFTELQVDPALQKTASWALEQITKGP